MNPAQNGKLGSTLSLAVLFCAFPAAAQKTDGKVQLGINTPIVSYQSYTVERSATDTQTSGIGWGAPGTKNQLGDSVVNLELGYGFGRFVVFGAMFRAEGGSTKYEPPGGNDEDQAAFGFAAGPKFDLVFSSGEEMRPFLGFAGGYAARWTSADVDGAPNRESSTSGFFVTGRFGLHVFATKTFSVDPMLFFNYRKYDETADLGVQPADVESSVSGYEAGLALGLSGWI
jgi:hypothetical protein